MNCRRRNWEFHATLASMLCALCISGCSTSDATTVDKNSRHGRPLRAGDPGIVPQEEVPEDFRPLSSSGTPLAYGDSTYADGSPTHYADGSPVYLVNGQPVDYRPRNLQRTLHTMTRLFIRDVGQPRLGFEGPAGSPQVEYLSLTPEATVEMPGDPNFVWTDPASGDTCWRALTCAHPECREQSEEPLIFAASVPGHTGTLEQTKSLENALAPMRCPRCGRNDNIENYDPPATIRREQELKAELERIRSGRL